MKKRELTIYWVINSAFMWFLGIFFGAILTMGWIALSAINGVLDSRHISTQFAAAKPMIIGVLVLAVIIMIVNLLVYSKKYRGLLNSLEK